MISAHHIAALYEALGFEVPFAIKNSNSFSQSFTEKLDLNKNLVAKVGKTLEL